MLFGLCTASKVFWKEMEYKYIALDITSSINKLNPVRL